MSYQKKILRAIRDHERVAVASAHGVGKTATAAIAVLDFLAEGPGRVVTTAPTWSQVEDLLWREIHKGYHSVQQRTGVPFGGKIHKTRIEISPDWFAVGLSTDQPERFQGHHAPRLMLVVDEASGVDDEIYEAARGFLTAQHARVLLIGNPTRLHGQFHRAFTVEANQWETFKISAFDSPLVTGERCSADAARALVTPRWIEDMREAYGEDHPVYQIRVMGEFALTSGRGFFNQDHLRSLAPAEAVVTGRMLGDPVRGGQCVFDRGSGPISVWELPKKNESYVIFADVAGGVSVDTEDARPPRQGGDYSCAQVVSLQTGAQVAELHLRCDEAEYACELARLAYWYNTALLCPENTGGYGTATITLLRDRYAYPRIYRREIQARVSRDPTERYGWDTNATTRPQMLAELARVLREDPARIRSRGVINEMRSFVWNKTGTKAEADLGSYDDRVLSLAGAFRLFTLKAETTITIGAAPKQDAPRLSVSQRAVVEVRSPRARPSTFEDAQKLREAKRKRAHKHAYSVSRQAQKGSYT